jgi:hypothetical protein
LFGESLIDAKKAPDERKGNPFGKRVIDVLLLMNAVFIDTLAKIYLMRLGQIKECA